MTEMTTTHMILRYAHITAGVLTLVTGAAAMTFRKGSPLHRKATALDVRMIVRGGLTGVSRTTRHLWRMSLAFFMATGSFFFGQPKFVPAVLRESGLYIVAGLLPLGLLLYWLVRVRVWPLVTKSWSPRGATAAARS